MNGHETVVRRGPFSSRAIWPPDAVGRSWLPTAAASGSEYCTYCTRRAVVLLDCVNRVITANCPCVHVMMETRRPCAELVMIESVQ